MLRCLKIRAGKTRKRIKSLSNKKWFDKECRLKRHELRKLANKKHQDPLNTTIREQYHDTLAQYKKLLNSKKNDYYNAKISELEKTADNSDAKTFWQCLKSMDDTRKGEDVPSISKENFHNLYSNEPLNPAQQNIFNELRQNECHGQHSRPTDFMITERKIRKASEKLKNNKSPFPDKIRNEMIKAIIDTLMPVYEKLFNSILKHGTMPQTWRGGLITAIYKSGGRSDRQTTGKRVSLSPAAWENYFVLS